MLHKGFAKKGLTAALTIVVTLSLLLVGCGAQKPSGQAESQPSGTPTPPAASQTPPAAAAQAEPVAGAQSSPVAPVGRIDIGTAASGGNLYVAGVHAAQQINANAPGLTADAIPTAGALENVKLLSRGDIQLGMAYSSNVYWARRGEENFPQDDFELVMTGYAVAMLVMAREDSGISNYCDLKGKKLVGPPAGAIVGWKIIDTALASCGLSRNDLASVIPTSNLNDGADQVKTGQADAVFWAVPRGGVGPLIDLANSVPIRYVGLTDEQMTYLGQELPYLKDMTLTQNWQTGAPAGIKTKGDALEFFTLAALDEQIVYALTKALIEGIDTWSEVFPAAGSEFNLETAISSRELMPYHAGAIKAYTEAGVWP